MKVAFHAPLKPPDSPKPSGDRRVARLLIRALKARGHDVRIASRQRTRDGLGDPKRQIRVKRLGKRLADGLVQRYRAPGAWCPDIWFTYHLYYKAPDWIGPAVAEALDIPYIVAEASHALKRGSGPWSINHQQVEAVLRRADLVIGLNSHDRARVEPALGPRGRYVQLRPFLEPKAVADRSSSRAALAARHDLPADATWLLAVGMMREDAKLESYRLLASAMEKVQTATDWRLIVVGDGPARRAVVDTLGPATVFTGTLTGDQLAVYYAAADLFVWPSIREAYGMALLEAQTAGLAAVAGDTGGVPDILRDGETGLLCPEGDAAAFAKAVDHLIDTPSKRLAMGENARICTALDHGFHGAADTIDGWLTDILRGHRSAR